MKGHKIVGGDSNTHSKTVTCECCWVSGRWPCDGSAEYDHYVHAAVTEKEEQ